MIDESAGGGKLSREQFLKLTRSKQKGYLKDYPQSSHRFLFAEEEKKRKEAKKAERAAGKKKPEEKEEKPAEEKEAKPEETKEEKPDEKAPVKRTFSKYVTRKQFALMSDEDKAAYLDKFPASVHRIGYGKMKRRPTMIEHDFSDHNSESLHKQLQEEMSGLDQETRGTINESTIRAFNDVSQDDLRGVGDDLDENAEDAADQVEKRWGNRPKLLHAGLNAIRKTWAGDETSPKEKNRAQRVITTSIRYALLGSGVAALALGAAPVAMVLGSILMNNWEMKDWVSGYDGRADDKKEKKEKEAAERKKQQEKEKKQIEKFAKKQKKKEKLAKKEAEEQRKQAAPVKEEEEEPKLEIGEDDNTDIEDDEDQMATSGTETGTFHDSETDKATLVELMRHLAAFMQNVDRDSIADNMRFVYGEQAKGLTAQASGSCESIEELAARVNGTIEDNFVVTASARYEYNSTTGRYKNG